MGTFPKYIFVKFLFFLDENGNVSKMYWEEIELEKTLGPGGEIRAVQRDKKYLEVGKIKETVAA